MGFPFRVLRRECLNSIDSKDKLEVERLFGPKRAVIIERGNPLVRRNKIGRAFFRHLFHEGGDRFLRCRVIPGG